MFTINGHTTKAGQVVRTWTRVDVSNLGLSASKITIQIAATREVVYLDLGGNKVCDLGKTPSGAMWCSVFRGDDNRVSHFNFGPPVEYYDEEPNISILKVNSGHIVHAVSDDLDPGNSGPCRSIFTSLGTPDAIEDRANQFIYAQSLCHDGDTPWTLFHLVTRRKRSETPTLARLGVALNALAERLELDGIKKIHCTKLECHGHNSLHWNDVKPMLRVWANEHRLALVVHAS